MGKLPRAGSFPHEPNFGVAAKERRLLCGNAEILNKFTGRKTG